MKADTSTDTISSCALHKQQVCDKHVTIAKNARACIATLMVMAHFRHEQLEPSRSGMLRMATQRMARLSHGRSLQYYC
jgi:hypothetical protein